MHRIPAVSREQKELDDFMDWALLIVSLVIVILAIICIAFQIPVPCE